MNCVIDCFFFFFFVEPQGSEFLQRFHGSPGLEEAWDDIQRNGPVPQSGQLLPQPQHQPLDGRLCFGL